MKRIVQTMVIASSVAVSAFALEFGTMGSHAFGMAGTGVAVKKSPWGLYYNPALIAADEAFKLGLYLEAHSRNVNSLGALGKKFDPMNVNDLVNLYQTLQDTRVSFGSQSGGVLQLPDFGIGAFSFGSFLHLMGNGSTKMTLPTIQQPPQPPIGFNQLGLEVNFSVFSLIEAPLAYAYEFDTFLGDLSVGVAVKYMKLYGTTLDFKLKDDQDFNPMKDVTRIDFGEGSSNVGVDVGVAYEPIDLITLGLVGKNLNAPTFDIGSKKVTIDPQVRAGVALNMDLFSLALDADLTANQYLGTELKNQMVSLGGMLDLGFFALRAGIAKDLKHKDDLIYALGLGLAFLDVGVQFGKKTSPFRGVNMPDYFAVQLGAGFSF